MGRREYLERIAVAMAGAAGRTYTIEIDGETEPFELAEMVDQGAGGFVGDIEAIAALGAGASVNIASDEEPPMKSLGSSEESRETSIKTVDGAWHIV